ncbi:hypothetical protein F5X96DRAFT_614655 [Biscogniauxia mediterranea]|nr:hypothetical protein F5X96DRAFT_614655 [Biscogniauxia mediterranea]
MVMVMTVPSGHYAALMIFIIIIMGQDSAFTYALVVITTTPTVAIPRVISLDRIQGSSLVKRYGCGRSGWSS